MPSELFNMLHHDHEILSNIVSHLENSSANKQWLFNQLRTGFMAHAKGEEYSFYPRLGAYLESSELVQESLTQHREMLLILESMKNISITSLDWVPSLNEFKNRFQGHVRLEENLLFLLAQHLFSNQQLEEITADFISEKQQVMNELARPTVE